MSWNRNDPTCQLVLTLCEELRDAADFCDGWGGPAQYAFARHIKGLGKAIQDLTVGDIQRAAIAARAEFNDLKSKGLV